MRQGKIRILFGSTFKMGAGTNVQDRLVANHDVDCPWRPSDLEQRAGRIVRQGNRNRKVTVFRYATSGTFDSYLWQTVQKKQEFISQIMSSKSPARSCEDVDETALSFAEIKALCAGNPLIAEKMNLDIEVSKLRMLKSEHQSQHYYLQDSLMSYYPAQIAKAKANIANIGKDIALFAERKAGLEGSLSANFPGMEIGGIVYKDKEPAAKALLDACKGVIDAEEKPAGEYMGFKMSLRYESLTKQVQLLLHGSGTYSLDLGTDTFGNISRINNALDGLPKRLEAAKINLDMIYSRRDAAKVELEQPFALADELSEKEARLACLDAELSIDGGTGGEVIGGDDEADLSDDGTEEKSQAPTANASKPSLKARLEAAKREVESGGRNTAKQPAAKAVGYPYR
ncbi:MAG: hypothetical protein LBS19_04290 [Clostridiales bacterium]|nr:hypothetical protein [Clostridiales bacterium]